MNDGEIDRIPSALTYFSSYVLVRLLICLLPISGLPGVIFFMGVLLVYWLPKWGGLVRWRIGGVMTMS